VHTIALAITGIITITKETIITRSALRVVATIGAFLAGVTRCFRAGISAWLADIIHTGFPTIAEQVVITILILRAVASIFSFIAA
jgi:hypothetical protein